MSVVDPKNPFKGGNWYNSGAGIKPTEVKEPENGFDGRPSMFSTSERVGIENWPGWVWKGIRKHVDQLNPSDLGAKASVWDQVGGGLDAAFNELQASMKAALESGWFGVGADGVTTATNNYVKSNVHLQQSINAMRQNVQGLSESLKNAQLNVPTHSQVRNTVNEKVGEIVSNWDGFWGSEVDWDNDGNLVLATDERYRDVFEHWVEQMNIAAREAMITNYDPGIRTSDGSLPDFLGTKNNGKEPPGRPAPGPGVPGSKNTGGGGGNRGGGGGGGKVPSGALGKPNIDKPNVKPSGLNQNGTGGADGLKNAMQGLSGIGQGAAGQLGNLANLGKNLAGKQTPSPHLLNSKKNLAKTGTGGKGGGKGGGGGGKGGGAGGAKPLGGPALREGLNNALKTASLGDRSLGSMSRATTSSPMMGGPMGGAGARGGGGGEDKVHKANKFLQTTANGEALLGVPLASVSSVLKAVPGDVKLAEVGAEASAPKT
ncbi:hypothetical protein GOARA_033_00160 [Gordonia araii NBRC 100433]|uniref:PPE family domain-containing protein n=1 Tax=Gordonia araii NBRC 100433 TaxID=1073574 RepID=G7H040_9ACTN|nr:hypothetical protein [Gordonia araii]NNG99052.1 hypothetical protein [Gordonia araii NBRC 100433]GAB09215.1 hypothetical protein GOARA_033_00160 [Gordonia araii NBRC 100433]